MDFQYIVSTWMRLSCIHYSALQTRHPLDSLGIKDRPHDGVRLRNEPGPFVSHQEAF